jgi:hypothetical protein
MSAALHTVHVRINDAATGQPTPVRVHFSTPDGKYLAPLGRLTDFAIADHEDVGGNLVLEDKRYAYIDGTSEIRLPPGPILMEIHKGPEYTPQFLQTTLTPGKMALRHEIQRWTDLRQDRWYSGDIRAHRLTPHAALLEAAAEDLAVVNLLVRERGHSSRHTLCAGAADGTRSVQATCSVQDSNILAFSGNLPALELPGHLVVVNTHNCHKPLGSLALLNCHRIVWPLSIDLISSPEEWSDWALADWADQCHRKGGLVVWSDMITLPTTDVGWLFGEPLADLLLGKIDAVELMSGGCDQDEIREYWYRLLNCGLRVPLVGGSGKDCNGIQLGSPRTYARLQPGEEFTYQTWIEAIRAGRTFVSNGPLLSLAVNGQDPGAVLDLPSLDQPVQVNLNVRSILPVDRLELVLNGEVILQVEAKGSPASACFEGSVSLPSAGWVAARCEGSVELPAAVGCTQQVTAHTSPIYVQVGGQAPKIDEDSQAFFLGHLDKVAAWTERQGSAGNGRPPRHVIEILQSARKTLVERGQA